MGRPTIRDVAQEAKVSVSSVSRVINGNVPVSPWIKEKVLAAIEKLHYIPNKHAQVLKKRRTRVMGVLIPDISNHFFSKIVRGIEKAAYCQGFSILIGDTENTLEKENKYIEVFLHERVDGVILISVTSNNEKIRQLLDNGIPIVAVDRLIEELPIPAVIVDNFRDGYKLTRYLIGLGYRRIGFIRGRAKGVTASGRYQGFLKAMEEQGIEVERRYIRQASYTLKGGYRAMKGLLKANWGDLPEAVIAVNDLMAIGAIKALRERELRVPEDMGIAGFGNIPIASLITPKLTTVDIPGYRMGFKAVELLDQCLNGSINPFERRILVLKTRLIKGDST
ncbi:MAG TPA: LacI family transcriptional regulator [Candidatus Acetothermia bacterium]|nr:LacI family transcriptional regulator [Candidatus Acetothermia bacterium]